MDKENFVGQPSSLRELEFVVMADKSAQLYISSSHVALLWLEVWSKQRPGFNQGQNKEPRVIYKGVIVQSNITCKMGKKLCKTTDGIG